MTGWWWTSIRNKGRSTQDTGSAQHDSAATPAALCVRFALLVALLLALPLAVALVGGPPPVSYVWDVANLLGFLSLSCMLLLLYYTGRPRSFPSFSGRFFANLHRDIGYLSLVFIGLHVGLLLLAEPLLVEHLKLTAPLYMLAGLAAAGLCLLLVLSSVTPLRRKLWADYRSFRQLHGWLSLLVLALALVHLGGSAFYLNHWMKLAVVGAVACTLAAYYLIVGPRSRVLGSGRYRLRNSARYSHFVSYGAALLLAGLVVLVVRGPGGE